jgi:hypothetical protein
MMEQHLQHTFLEIVEYQPIGDLKLYRIIIEKYGFEQIDELQNLME